MPPRYQFIADAEVVEVGSGIKLKAKTGDLSIGGCFLDVLNPSPEGTEIQVTIFRENAKFSDLAAYYLCSLIWVWVSFSQVCCRPRSQF